MNTSSNPALAELRDIHLPDAPGLWPLAPGWWLLLVLSISIAALLFWHWRRNRARRVLRAQGRKQLQAIRADWEQHHDKQQLVNGLADLLRRVVKQIDSASASKTGNAWLHCLDELGATDAFTRGQGVIFGDSRYAPAYSLESNNVDGDALLDIVEAWLRSATARHVTTSNSTQEPARA